MTRKEMVLWYAAALLGCLYVDPTPDVRTAAALFIGAAAALLIHWWSNL